MKHPIIITIDDDPEVLQTIAGDVRRKYGGQFRIIRANSGEQALSAVQEIKLGGESVALFLADQRMPGMDGVDFLEAAAPLFPDAKRALLTAYADTDAAIKAINDVHLDYYLMKPWDPPEERLYPVLDDLLDDWSAGHRPDFEGIRLIGQRWSAESNAMREFLARNQIPFRWLEAGVDPAAQPLLDLAALPEAIFPVVILENGEVLVTPSLQTVATAIGLRPTPGDTPVYDLIVIGAGPAGLAAAVYGASEGLRTVVIERFAGGGQAGMSSRIENYLGFPSGVSGDDLARRAMTQAQRFGAECRMATIADALEVVEGSVGVRLEDGSEIRGHSMIVATGVDYRRLDAPGIEQLTGRGVFYGAARSQSHTVMGEDIFIVGGANSAGQAAVYFSEIAKSVTMLHRGPNLTDSMSHYLVERIEQSTNISVRTRSEVVGASGDDHLESIEVRNADTGEIEHIPAHALFIFIGAIPPTKWLAGAVALDTRGFILTGPDLITEAPGAWPLERAPFMLETSVPGVFAAGDVRHGSGKRVATAVGEGSMAVMTVWQYRTSVGL